MYIDNMKIKKIFLDMDGCLCNFDKQYHSIAKDDVLWDRVMNSKGLISKNKMENLGIGKDDFDKTANEIRQEALNSGENIYPIIKNQFKTKLMCNPAWKLIVFAGEEFWSTMEWQPGGNELVEFVKTLNVPIEILTAGSGDSASNGKQKWLANNELGDYKFNITNIGKEKHIFADDGYLLIDDLSENIELFVEAGGLGVIHKETSQTINEINKLL